MAMKEAGWYHLVPDSVVLKGLGQRRTLTCYCCAASYQRGQFKCCAPPKGMASHKWASLWCPPVDQGGCGKCARHCQCPSKAERIGSGPLAQLGKDWLEAMTR